MTRAVVTLLTIARKELGVHEEPAHSNSGPRVREYQAATFLTGTGWPWCIAFLQWCFVKAGIPVPYRSAGAFDLLAWAKRVGWVDGRPRPGDIGIVREGAGHGCLVVDVISGVVHSIDGNHGDAVATAARPLSAFAGFIRHPSLDKPLATMPPKKKPPIYVIATSSNGHAQVVATAGRAVTVKRVAAKLASWLGAGKRVTIYPKGGKP